MAYFSGSAQIKVIIRNVPDIESFISNKLSITGSSTSLSTADGLKIMISEEPDIQVLFNPSVQYPFGGISTLSASYALSSSYSVSSSYAPFNDLIPANYTGSFTGTFSGDGANLINVVATAIPAGPNFAIQFKNGVSTSGSSNFTFNGGTNVVSLTGTLNNNGTINSGHIIPVADSIYNLGSPSNRWGALYISGSTIYLGNITLKDNNGTLSVTIGSSTTPAPFSGSLIGSASYAPSSWNSINNIPIGVVSSSLQVIVNLPIGTVSSSGQISYIGLSNITVGIHSSSAQLPIGLVSSSFQINTGSFSGTFKGDGSGIINVISSSAATSASSAPGAFDSTINRGYSGSFTGSVTGTLLGTSSYASFASTASYAISSSLSITASYEQSSSYSLSSSYAPTSWNSINNIPVGIVSSSIQVLYSGLSGTPIGIISSSGQVTYVGITGIPTGIASSSAQTVTLIAGQQINPAGVSGSHTGSFTGFLLGSASFAPTAWNVINNIPISIVSSSGQITYFGLTGIPVGIISSSGQVSYIGLSNIPIGIASSSTQIVTLISGQQISPTGISSSFTGSLIGSSSYSLSGSYALSASNAISASYAPGAGSFDATINRGYSGSFTGSVTGALQGSSSYAITSSYALTSAGVITNAATASLALFLSGTATGTYAGTLTGALIGSASFSNTAWNVINNIPVGIVSSSGQVTYAGLTGIPIGIVSSSGQVSYAGLSNIPIGIVSSSTQTITLISGQQINPAGTSGSHTGSFTGSLLGSASFSPTAWNVINNIPVGIISGSTQIISLLPIGVVSSSGQITYAGLTGIPIGIVSSSTQTISLISGQQISPAGVTSSLFGTSSWSNSGSTVFSASAAGWALSSSYAQTFLGTQATIGGVLYSSSTAAVGVSTVIIAQIPSASYDMAHFDYLIKSGSNLRAGTVYSVWNQIGTVNYTEVATTDVGNTSDVTLTSDTLGANVRLNATSISTGWTVKTIIRSL